MIERLARRVDFVRMNRDARRAAVGGVVLQAMPMPPATGGAGVFSPPQRVGFTATKKLGGAVVRNRVKRRLRALAEEVLPVLARPGHDYVLIGRQSTVTRPYQRLRGDLIEALRRLRLLCEANDPAVPAATDPGKTDAGDAADHSS